MDRTNFNGDVAGNKKFYFNFGKRPTKPHHMIQSEPYPLTQDQIKEWLRDTILHGVGYIVVENAQGYRWCEHLGQFTVTRMGHTEIGKRTRSERMTTMLSMLNTYKNFERNGYYYYYGRGSWRRFKKNSINP